jgi:hypothetical protein
MRFLPVTRFADGRQESNKSLLWECTVKAWLVSILLHAQRAVTLN